MAKKNKADMVGQEQAPDIEQIKRRLDMLDQRLDNIDSIITAVAERVMHQPITLNVICPGCGKNIEIAMMGSRRQTG